VIYVVRILQDTKTPAKPKKDKRILIHHANGTRSLNWSTLLRVMAFELFLLSILASLFCMAVGAPWFSDFLFGIAASVVALVIVVGALRVFARYSSMLNTPAQTKHQLACDAVLNAADHDATTPGGPLGGAPSDTD